MGTRSSQEARKSKGDQVADQSTAPKPQADERRRQVAELDALTEERMRDRLKEKQVLNDFRLNDMWRKQANQQRQHHNQREEERLARRREEEARRREEEARRRTSDGEPRRSTSSMAASVNTRRGSGFGQ